MAQLWPL